MSGIVNLKDIAYANNQLLSSQTEETYIDLDGVVNDIILEFVKKHTELINDVERGIVPKESLEKEIMKHIDESKISLPGMHTRKSLMKKVLDYIFGYGIIQHLIEDKDISDIRIIGTNPIRIKKLGERSSVNLRFTDEKALKTYCTYLSIKNGGNLSESTAQQKLSDATTSKDFRLRLNITIPPVGACPVISIRKLPKKKPTIDDLIKVGMLNEEIKEYYLKAVEKGLNIIFCGKGGSGKTTLMSVGLDYIPQNESVLVMQETEELMSNHPDIIFEKVKYKSGESDVEYSLRDLTVNGLLQDLDRMIIGEIKGAEAMDFFNGVYTGHVGWTSLHSANARGALLKAVHYMKYSGTDLSQEALLEMLSEVDLIVYMRKYKVVEMVEVAGYDRVNKTPIYNTVFEYRNGTFTKVGESCEKILEKFERW